MCGIAGVAGKAPDQETLRLMGLAIAHRGPDESSEKLFANAGFAFRRLSIIDIAGGHQPIFNEEGTAAIVLNGEIYNHRELRTGLEARGHRFRTRSDVETVIHLWEEKGAECLNELRGMFALAIWDEREQTMLLARDRLGKKPLYYCELEDGGLVFGSEIKAILQFPNVRREPDLAAIDHFLTLQYVPSPLTAFRGIKRLPPAHWLRWAPGHVESRRYWKPDFDDKLQNSEEELREEALRLLREAVQIRLESEVPLGAFLSGGIDSSAVVAMAAGSVSGRLKTFSIGFESQAHDESAYARIVAERFDTDHHELVVGASPPGLLDDIVWHYDQPFGDSSAVPSFLVARITRPHVTVVLNGDGGDESFAGYERYKLSDYEAYFRLPKVVRRGIATAALPAALVSRRGRRFRQMAPDDGYKAYFSTLLHLNFNERNRLYSLPLLHEASTQESPPLAMLRSGHHSSLLDAMLETDLHNYLPDDLLIKMDVATMAHSLEARSPFLDHMLVEFMARVPPQYKRSRGVSKVLLKSALQGILPEAVLNRRKMGFGIPLGHWLRTSLKEQLTDTVLSERAMQRGYFKPKVVRDMVRSHMAGGHRYQNALWDLLQLELWHRAFIDEAPVPRQPLLTLTRT
jgi:asparagine synthase (glutamine-hydrolysing)